MSHLCPLNGGIWRFKQFWGNKVKLSLQKLVETDIDVEKLEARTICFVYQMLVFITIYSSRLLFHSSKNVAQPVKNINTGTKKYQAQYLKGI